MIKIQKLILKIVISGLPNKSSVMLKVICWVRRRLRRLWPNTRQSLRRRWSVVLMRWRESVCTVSSCWKTIKSSTARWWTSWREKVRGHHHYHTHHYYPHVCVFVKWRTCLLCGLFCHSVREKIGPIATPDFIQNAPGLPKTRSGNIIYCRNTLSCFFYRNKIHNTVSNCVKCHVDMSFFVAF